MRLKALLPYALGALLFAAGPGTLRAQLELQGSHFNRLFQPPATVPNEADNDPPILATQPQFAGATSKIGGSAVTFVPDTLTTPIPTTLVSGMPYWKPFTQYPSDGNPAGQVLVLQRSSIGTAVAAGVPRYSFGEIIQPPATQADGVTPAAPDYWRIRPVEPGELFAHPQGGADTVPTVPALPVGTLPSYYFSKHAQKVFAAQAGPVSITWVARVPHTLPNASPADNTLRYRTRTESFVVSSVSQLPLRKIYWSERSFNSPAVSIPSGSIEAVNPVYTNNFPAQVANEFQPVGISTTADPNSSAPAEKRTVWFERTVGIGSLHAYNLEGRIMIEYLGALKPGSTTEHVFLGADIVEVARLAPSINVSVLLGDRLTPRDQQGNLLPLDGGPEWIASPVLNAALDGKTFYGTSTRADGQQLYYAERENDNPDRVSFYWLQQSDAAIHFLPAPARPNLGIYWPQLRNNYSQVWPGEVTNFHAHYTVGTNGSNAATGTSLAFAGGQMPEVIFQDDPTQTEAKLDPSTQRLNVGVPGDGLNRTLLKFTSGSEVWYVRLYTQADERAGFQEGDGGPAINATATVGQRIEAPGYGYTSAPTVTFSGGGGTGATAVATIDPTTRRITGVTVTSPGHDYTSAPTVTFSGGGGSGAIAMATVANGKVTRVTPVNSIAGYIQSGTGYLPGAYASPFTVGIAAAEQKAIIPVNAHPGDNVLKIWWFQAVQPPTTAFAPLYVPAKVGRYTVSYPSNPDMIVLASNAGSGDLSPAELAGSLYVQNDRTKPGFNPNEEHAVMLAGRAYALRDDLNNVSASPAAYTSEPFVLISYTSTADGRPAMHAFKVVRELDLPDTANDVLFNYTVTAGTILQGPMPLPILPLPLKPDGTVSNTEVPGTADSAHQGPGLYTKFTFEDRKGYHWVYRGPHASGTPTLGMQFYYTMREGFFVPDRPTQPAVGTVLPYLRPLTGPGGTPEGDAVTGTSLTVIYRPAWPALAPALRVAESLALPKFGLPAVLNQTSADVLYQQSIAAQGATKPSVLLHDPIREKTTLLASDALDRIPASARTSVYQGKTYFQGLPPHLQSRFFHDPNRGPKGGLVLLGRFIDEIAGEDYLQLNTLSADDVASLKAVVQNDDVDAVKWRAAIDALGTRVEKFIEDPAKLGTYKVGSSTTVGGTELPRIDHPDTAVVDYALTATGEGAGWVTLVFGNGRAFTPAAEPVSVQVIKVVPQLYTGELKVNLSTNPLDEQVTLRHSGDFAAKPGDYEFEWRYAPPQDGVAPPIYTYAQTSRLGSSWQLVQNPAGPLPTPAEYAEGTSGTTSRSVVVWDAGYNAVAGQPGLVLRSTIGVDFTAGVPAQIIFSADLGDHTGLVLYVNGVPALASGAPAPFANVTAATGLVSSGGLSRQFTVSDRYFTQGVNTVEIALYSTGTAGVTSTIDFRLHASAETDLVALVSEGGTATSTPWSKPNGTLLNQAIVGGSPTAPLGSPLLVMSDNYFTMRYRPKASANSVAGTAWSRWMPPKLVEGWIKRVLAGINPFNQRVRDLFNNAVNTDVSILTQAGQRWEGNVALNLANINDFGLIEIYETVLGRGKTLSIDSGFDYGPANDALLLVAGYLNDLYTVLGNEAFADGANPTISIDDSTTITEVNTSRFSFEGQVKNVLEEELALLRGRDDFLSPSVTVAPAYNRLYWNYTRGINSGEALYAINYNIREKAGSATADGNLDAADAQRMFPQGHGDAYGHYLTALKVYYRLLTSSSFTWTPRSEAVNVLGQAVQIDYFDERKFASAAANVARTAEQVLTLTHRQNYKDEPLAGWGHFRDGKANATTGTTRQWGLDEWASRATQGAYYHWIVGNAILPETDTNPSHTGVQVIDRKTVPALAELPATAESFQLTMDNANAHLNPLGLSPGAIAFDISPAELRSGQSHYEQIHTRALRAVLNAKGAFDQAAKMTRLLRNQENQAGNSNDAIVDQEKAFTNRLIEIYGTPYPGEIGAGKTYAQGYTGPDLLEWFIVDRATDVIDTTPALTLTVRVPTGVSTFTGFAVADITAAYTNQLVPRTLTLQPNQYVQFSDTWQNGASMGVRSVTGKLQQALLDVQQSHIALQAGVTTVANKHALFERRRQLYDEMVATHILALGVQDAAQDEIARLRLVQAGLQAIGAFSTNLGKSIKETALILAQLPPKVVGLANDTTSAIRTAIESAGGYTSQGLALVGVVATNSARYIEAQAASERRSMEKAVAELAFNYEQAQVAYEYEILLRDLLGSSLEIVQLATTHQRAAERVRNVIAEGDRVLADRETFRQRAAAIVQGYRTRDLTFRTFRNEALEQYRSLFDLASRYTYLSAKSYDYETGLLGSSAGQSVINGIVAARSLGDLTGGVPQATVSTLGDAGLAGTMARLQSDWSVAKSRLGINNPDQNGTLFSLRRELFRLLDDPAVTTDDTAWQQTLEQHIMSNVLDDSDVAVQCRNLVKPDGSAVPGIVIPFRTTIEAGLNFFGLPLAANDHAFSVSNFATKIHSVGMVLRGYVGMDPYAPGSAFASPPLVSGPNALSATPYVYLIPVGTDYMRAPPLGEQPVVRGWNVRDQALPLPFNLGATAFSTTQFFRADGTLSEQPWILRKHQAFRPVSDPLFFYTSMPAEFTSSRLVGRSVWNGGWKIVIPANTLLNQEQDGLNRFVATVKDIELFLRTYSHSGN